MEKMFCTVQEVVDATGLPIAQVYNLLRAQDTGIKKLRPGRKYYINLQSVLDVLDDAGKLNEINAELAKIREAVKNGS